MARDRTPPADDTETSDQDLFEDSDKFGWGEDDLIVLLEPEDVLEGLEETEEEYVAGVQPRHPSGSPMGGQWARVGGSPGVPGHYPKIEKLTTSAERAWNGEPKDLKHKLSKLEAGQLGEAIAVKVMQKGGAKDAGLLNVKGNNFPVDLAHNHEVVEVKTGLASNSRAAQQWRATIGQPGVKEAEWLAKASPDQKAAWNAKKQQMILRRKKAIVRDFSSKLGVKLEGSTMAMIIDSDRKIVDVYRFKGFHNRIGWSSSEAASAYVGSYKYE